MAKRGNQGDGGGRPRKELTQEQVIQVEALASVLSQDQLADYLGVSRSTFHEIMKRDTDVSERYKRGKAKAVGSVAKSLIQQAQEGNISAAIFYLKTQAGWKEEKEQADVSKPVEVVITRAKKDA